ncbi:MAG: tRNA-intron lyase [Asgard group archaeon]|nr:tRNA-intron lyase [Asgard group archaeon]
MGPPSKNSSQKNKIAEKKQQLKEKMDAIIAVLRKNDVYIEDHQDARIIYDNGFYGLLQDDKTLSLNYDEALHLLERGVIIIVDEDINQLEVNDCARIFSKREESFWENYLVFKDLRNRGYIVGRGISELIKYRLYPRGAKIGKDIAKILICPLAERKTIKLKTLDDMVIQSQSLKKKLLIACVDRLGDVSYYELQTLFK